MLGKTLVRLNLRPPRTVILGWQRMNPDCPLKKVALHLLVLMMKGVLCLRCVEMLKLRGMLLIRKLGL